MAADIQLINNSTSVICQMQRKKPKGKLVVPTGVMKTIYIYFGPNLQYVLLSLKIRKISSLVGGVL